MILQTIMVETRGCGPLAVEIIPARPAFDAAPPNGVATGIQTPPWMRFRRDVLPKMQIIELRIFHFLVDINAHVFFMCEDVKEMVAFALLGVVIGTGWNQSFKNHYYSLRGISPGPATVQPGMLPYGRVVPVTPPLASPARSAPPQKPDNSWIWQETKMDKPYKRKLEGE